LIIKRQFKTWFIAGLLAVFMAGYVGYDKVSGDTSSSPIDSGSSETGVTYTQEVPFVKETLDEIKERESNQPAPILQQRVIPFHKEALPKELPVPELPLSEPKPQSEVPHEPTEPSLAPALSNDFSGLDDNNAVIPPDTMGAAGPSYLVEILNSEVAFLNKSTGAIISTSKVSLQSFWSSLGTGAGQAAKSPFDPKVIYDQHSGRFIIVTLGYDSTTANSSWLMIAVSATSDPTGTWYKWAIDADKDGGVQTYSNWADFPGLGVDADYVYVTANMFNTAGTYQYSKVWVIPKPQLLNGSSSITVTEFPNPSGSGATMQPAHVFGSSSTQYLIHQGSPITGPPLRRFHRISSITFPGGTPTWTDMGYIEVTAYPTSGLPNAPQLGSTNLIETNDARLLNAVLRNGYIWTTHTVANETNTKTEVAWYQINPASASPSSPYGTPAQQGRISDTTRWYYYPSIAVNSNGDAGIGFSGSSTSEYAGAYYTARQSSDTSGTMQSVAALKAGLASYYKTFSGTANRWGDYSATCIDPDDDLRFWTLQEYASTPSGGSDRWGTWWGTFALPPLAPSGLSASAASASQINLSWTDNSSNETGFKIERKTGAGGTYSEIGTPTANTTTYNDTGLSESTTYYYRVRAYNASGNSSYSDEAGAVTLPAAPSGLSASAVSASQIDLSWTDNSSGEDFFSIERNIGIVRPYSEIARRGVNTTTYSDTGLSEFTSYNYRVRAYPMSGNPSTYSNVAGATTIFPAVPSGLSASAVSASQINLIWTDNSSIETGFRIERKTGAGGTYSEIGTPTANTTTYNDTGLSESTTYYYRVRAYNTSGNSSYSDEANATTPASSSGGGGGGGGGCFIATASFGTPLAPEVIALSKFRDEHLLTNPAGRVMVSIYYKVSPSIAEIIKERPVLRKITCCFLKPVAWFLRDKK